MAEPIGPVRQSGAVPPTYLSSQETTNSIISRILKQLREGEYKEALQTLKANEDRLGYTPEKIRVIRLVISTWDRVYSLYKTPEDFSRALEVVDNNIPPVPAGRDRKSVV